MKPCPTCNDDYVFEAGAWIHAGTALGVRCPAVTPGLKYTSKDARAALEAESERATQTYVEY